MTTYLYARTSTDEQSNGMKDQAEKLYAWALARGNHAVLVEEQASAKSLKRRPELVRILTDLDANGGQLAVTTISRLSRSVADFAAILDRSTRHGWTMVVLDMGGGETLDTSTPVGRLMVGMVVQFAQFEREIISVRIKDALRQVKASGKQLGKPTNVSASTKQRIARLRRTHTLQQVADRLNQDDVPTPSGEGKWDRVKVWRHGGAR